jgi:hypothetical protein
MSDTAESCHHAPGNHAPALFCQLPKGEPIPATVGDYATWPVSAPWHCVAYSRTANTPRPRRGGGGDHILEPLSRESAGARHDVRPAERHPRHCWSCAAAPVPVAPRRALLQQLRRCQARGDGTRATPATVSRTDHRQRLPRAHLKTPRPTTTPLPSKPPLFGYRTRHDDETVARTARTAANSAVLHAILPRVAKQCGMPVIHNLLGL